MSKKKNTPEGRVAQTLLEEKKTIEIGGKQYDVAPPSLATLIKVSELVSYMPEVDPRSDDPISEALRVARESDIIPDILATVILGARKIKEGEESASRRFFFRNKKMSRLGELSSELMYGKTLKELHEMLVDFLVNRMEIGFFLGITTSLGGVNMTKPTKTTASGQS